MFFKRTLIAVILLVTFCSIVFGASVYKSQRWTLTNPRITSSGGSGKSEHYTITNVQIGNIAGGKAESEHYTIEAFSAKKKLPPKPPAVNPVTSPTNNPNIALSGTKDKNTSICVNGYEVIPLNIDTTWSIASYNIGGEEGQNILSITSKNKYNLESPSAIVNITLDTTPPQITITSPINGAVIDNTPIAVTGAIDEPCDVIVHGVLATVSGNTFTSEGIDLRKGENIITATAYDMAGNFATSIVTINSTVTSDYELIKLTEDIYSDNPRMPTAGTQLALQAKLIVDGQPCRNEPVKFTVISGNSSLLNSRADTNAEGITNNTLILDTSSRNINQIEAYAVNYPAKNITFFIATKPDIPNQLIKISDELTMPVPGTTVSLIAEAADRYGNPVSGQEVQFRITSGGGSLSGLIADTTESGIAKVYFATLSGANQTARIEAKLTSNPAILTIFTITTSELPQAGIDEVLAKVQANDSLIHDVMADIHVTNNAPWMVPESYLKIWIKGNKQKVQEISPNLGTYIRPVINGTINLDKELLSYNPSTAIYAIKFKSRTQAESYPYIVHYIDYAKGVIAKTEYHIRDNDFETTSISEYTGFIQINGAWGYQTQTDKIYGEDSQLLYTTTNAYSNIRINTGISDSEFLN